MTATLRGKTAVIASGVSPVGRVPGRSPLWLAADATRHALAEAGLRKGDIDGVLACSAFASPFHRFSVAFSEYLGIQPTFSNTLQVSGATAATMFHVAAAAITGGLAETVLVVGADSLLTGLTPDLALRAMSESRDQQYEMPFGIPVANTFAMTAQR
ncbi:MAG TPA: thiolase, partial [Burkholderiaceae bacterium]|nr:thiolase [Burkholderiaceae bacterium]